jgi:cell division septum initiation protein DivIVA
MEEAQKTIEGMQKENERVQKENAALKQRVQDIEAKVTSGGGNASTSV